MTNPWYRWWHLDWLPHPLWALWRDLTWCRVAKREWLAKLHRYYDQGGNARAMALDRARGLASGEYCWDWDDNIPASWVRRFLREVGER